MYPTETDPYTPIVSRVLRVEDVTWGNPQKDFIVRYRGQLFSPDSAASYDQLSETLKTMEVTPLFRSEGGRHVVTLIAGVIRPKPSKTWVNIVLFVLTVISVLFAGAIYSYQGPPATSFMDTLRTLLNHLGDGIPFAVSLLAILLAHEFGHYLAARWHHTRVTLPYFIPLPFSPLGTMGAAIQIKELPKNKRIMLDIGIAGPLAGLVVAIPLLLIGLHLSKVSPLPHSLAPGEGFQLEGNSLLYLLLKFISKGELLPAPTNYGNLPPLLYWIRYIITGIPLPWGGRDVILHPIAWAGWAGLLVTSLNLIPAGQLDGGHIMYVLFGRRAVRLVPFILVILVLLGFVWPGWLIWALLIFWLGRIYMEPLDQITPLDPPRRLLAVLAVVLFIFVFIPVPLIEVIGGM